MYVSLSVRGELRGGLIRLRLSLSGALRKVQDARDQLYQFFDPHETDRKAIPAHDRGLGHRSSITVNRADRAVARQQGFSNVTPALVGD